jgi:metal-dependent amidase/aminoacylase/carboxypeptidase family protein
MFLTEHQLTELIAWRHELHRRPELSGQEEETARTVQALLHATGADKVVTGLGGHGVLGIFEGGAPGPTVMLRAELDGLPIQETSELAYRSSVPGKAHLCGHDGHMTILAAVARGLSRQRPKRGRALLLFPAGGRGRLGRGGSPCRCEVR